MIFYYPICYVFIMDIFYFFNYYMIFYYPICYVFIMDIL